jgi:hypothetical protein
MLLLMLDEDGLLARTVLFSAPRTVERAGLSSAVAQPVICLQFMLHLMQKLVGQSGATVRSWLRGMEEQLGNLKPVALIDVCVASGLQTMHDRAGL